MALLLSLFRNRTKATLSTSRTMLNSISQHDFSTTKKTIEIPVKPKRPMTPYLRYIYENHSTITPPADTKKPTVYIMQQLAARWPNVDADIKSRLTNIYEKDKNEYIKKLAAYESSLTDEQRAIIRKAQEEKKTSEEKKLLKNKRSELGKPKRPQNGYSLFLVDVSKKQSNLKATELSKMVTDAWSKLNENEKSRYNKLAKAANEKYKKDIAIWEDKMIKEGHLDVLSKKTLTERQKTSEAKTPKNKNKK